MQAMIAMGDQYSDITVKHQHADVAKVTATLTVVIDQHTNVINTQDTQLVKDTNQMQDIIVELNYALPTEDNLIFT